MKNKEQLAKMVAEKIDAAFKASDHPKKFFITENGRGVGGALPYGLDYIGNAQNSLKLPLGENDGSVFILAKTLKLNANSRIGVTAVKNLEGYANYHAANPGANLMLIADNVENFKQDCFSTNGGFCFIYCD